MTDPDDQRSAVQDAASAPVRRMLGFVERIGLEWEPAQLAHPTLLPVLVFHEHGYRGNAAGLHEALRRGAVLGQPLLAWLRLTDFGRDAQGPHVYPAMRRWLRE